MKTQNKVMHVIMLICMLLLGCESNNSMENLDSTQANQLNEGTFKQVASDRTSQVPTVPTTNQPPPPIEEISQKLIKTANIRFESEEIEDDYQKIKELIQQVNGYVENEDQSKDTYRISYNMTIRVEAGEYDALYNNIIAVPSKVDNKSSQVQDVTDQYFDLETRINNLKVLEKRYLDILSGASEVKDMLSIEKKINEVRTDIERLESHIKVMSKQIKYSTIHIHFYQVFPYTQMADNGPGFWARMAGSLDDGLQLFLSFLVGVAAIWPFFFLIVGGILFFRYIRKKGSNLNYEKP